MDLEKLRARREARRLAFGRQAAPKGLLLAPILLVGVLALGYYMMKSGLSLGPPQFILPVPPPGADGTVRLVPGQLTTKAVMKDEREADLTADIMITLESILVNGAPVISLEKGELPQGVATDEGTLPALLTALEAYKLKAPAKPDLKLAAHVSANRQSTFKILKAVGDTAERAGFRELSFETLEDKQDP